MEQMDNEGTILPARVLPAVMQNFGTPLPPKTAEFPFSSLVQVKSRLSPELLQQFGMRFFH